MELTPMTRREMSDLLMIVKLRAKVTKNEVTARAAKMLADMEQEMAATYRSDATMWKDITKAAEEAIAKADEQIAAICCAQGIREEFRPSINLSWWSRGENAVRERRAELRRVAEARIDAGVKEANRRLEAWQVERSTVLLAGQLSSDEASHFFKSLPTPEELLPQVQIPEVAPRRITDRSWTPE